MTKYMLNGKQVTYEEFMASPKIGLDIGEAPNVQPRSAWPLVSQAMGCHTSQIESMQKRLREHGCDTEYTPTGEPILRSRGHRAEVMKIFGYFDHDAGYSDPKPGDSYGT